MFKWMQKIVLFKYEKLMNRTQKKLKINTIELDKISLTITDLI